jgi:indole-3-glycerol phosphate synthase
MAILDDILRHKRGELLAAQRAVPEGVVFELARKQEPAHGFARALRPAAGESPRLIAEIKKVSPAKGSLNPDMDVRAMARTYEANGASAISVLTDSKFFGGGMADLVAVRGAVSLPVLRKDFLFSPYHLAEARANGADAALLIVAALASPLADLGDLSADVQVSEDGDPDLRVAEERLRSLLAVAREVGIDVLVEVHDEAELEVALAAQSEVIGVNNRNLRTFETKLEVTERLMAAMPNGALLVSESGISTGEDVRRVQRAGVSAVLVGSSIVSASDPAAKVRELVGR